MATNQTGIAIVIKAWLPTGKGLDEQYAALTLVKQAHETGDYAPLLSAAQIEAVQTDSKTRRVEDIIPAAEAAAIVGIVSGTVTQEQLAAAYDSMAGTPEPEPAATDDALAERPDMTEPDGTVVEPAVDVPEPKASRKKVA